MNVKNEIINTRRAKCCSLYRQQNNESFEKLYQKVFKKKFIKINVKKDE